MTRRTRKQALLLVVAGALFATACAGQGGDSDDNGADPAVDNDNGSEQGTDEGDSDAPVTITWWHNSNNEPGRGVYEQAAADFMEANPHVTIEISAQEHEDMGTRLNAAFQSGDMPDIYMERGGGELAAHVAAGLTKDITDLAADAIANLGGVGSTYEVDGRAYALPFTAGAVGFWYNTDLFDEAGITDPPQNLNDWFAAVDALKAADIEPVAVGARDGWPAAHYWYYTALRQCSEEVLTEAVNTLDFSDPDPCFVRAGETLQEIIDAEPYNAGFLATPAQEGPTSASGLLATERVAMELAGHWEPGVMQGLTEDGQGLAGKLGWFPFPEIPGQEGEPGALIGGGDAWALSANAPDVAADFISYLVSDEMQQTFGENNMGLPVNPAASGSIADPALAGLIEPLSAAPYNMLYFDTQFGESIGGAMNDKIVEMFAGDATPEDIVDAIRNAYEAEQ
jgi:raffinose/stachyose/melibiose transport system substrate-binding protein